MPTILDFQIQPLSAESYSLAICERGSTQSLASATFSHRVDFLTDFSVDRLNASTKDAGERFDELQKLGRELYQKLFPPAVEQVWREHKQRSEFLILCLRFAEAAKKLEVLPWETLHDGAEFIAAGAKTTLTRLPLDVAPPSELPLIPRPLKLFGFFASPLDLGDNERLNAEREQEILLEAINDPAGEGRISADFEDEAKLEILARSLRNGYHILHFTGHGITPRDGGGLLLEDAQGKKLPASIADVMQAVESGAGVLRLAVISGCQTARTLYTGAFSDLARELLRQRVPAVIAMQFSITDEGGLKFAEVLYREIAKGVELERAVHAARRVLLEDKQFFINNDALAIVLLTADGACLRTTEAEATPPQAEPGATYLGDRLDPLAHGFYGRRREYRKLRDALLHQDQRAAIIHGVIIHGMGGIGKTALLTHAIHRLRLRFKDVMSFDCRRAALAPETILLELHRYFAAQGMPHLQSLIGQNVPPETLADEIAWMLTEWPLLIVFDNFESQLDERREIANVDLRVFLAMLVRATATGSRFLFTTRYLFDLDGERLSNLQELPLGDLSRAEALMLMQKLPNLAQAAYRDKLAALEKFGGHPYALVTLDWHCNHQPLDQALKDASSLASELREFLAIELNYRRLSDQARELLNRLAAFRGGVPFAAVEWVTGKKVSYAAEWLQQNGRDSITAEYRGLEETELLQFLEEDLRERRQARDLTGDIAELMECGLLTPQVNDGQLEAVSVHALVRDFCSEQQAGECWRNSLRDAAAFYTNQTKLILQDDKTLTAVLGEMEAFELLMETSDSEDAAKLLMITHTNLARWGYSHYLEGQYRRLMDKTDYCAKLGVLSDWATAGVLHNWATLLHNRGKYDVALAQYQQSLKIREKINDYAGVALSLHQIGNLHYLRGEYKTALEHYQRSLKTREELSDRAGVAQSLHNIGIIHQCMGEYEAALDHYHRSLKIKEELDDRAGMAYSLHQSGRVYQNCGKYEEALVQYQQCLDIAKQLDDRLGMAHSLHQIGNIRFFDEKYAVALEYYQQSLKIREELGDRVGIAASLHQIGLIYQEYKEYKTALAQYQKSFEIAEELGDRALVASSHAQIGLLFTEISSYAEAFGRLLFALVIFTKLQSPEVATTIKALKYLRAKWGKKNFDDTWEQAYGDMPDWLR